MTHCPGRHVIGDGTSTQTEQVDKLSPGVSNPGLTLTTLRAILPLAPPIIFGQKYKSYTKKTSLFLKYPLYEICLEFLFYLI